MQNVTFGYPNRTDEGTLSGGAWQPTLPLANLKSRVTAKVARSADALEASTQWDIDFLSPRYIGALALLAHNISVSGTIRLRGSTTADFTGTVYDSAAVPCWPAGVIPQSLLEWEEDNFWLGTLSAEARAGYQAPYIHLFARTNARYWRIEISDTGNADGYVQIGRLFIADVWTPALNMSYGTALGYTDKTQVDESLGGTEYFDTRKKTRLTRFNLDWMTSEEAYARLLEMTRLLGVSGELLLSPDSDDTTNQIRRAYIGRLNSMGALTHPRFGQYSTQIEIKELL